MSGRFALIIGNSKYEDPNLPPLETPVRDAKGLADILQNQKIGGFEVSTLLDQPGPSIQRHIARFLRGRKTDDLLLLYFSGHGIRDDQGRLYLAVKDTEHDILGATAIPASFITNELDNSASKRQILILDCCHSGAFGKGGIGTSAGIKQTFEGTGTGRVVMTASNAIQNAWEGGRIAGDITSSLFTHYLIEGLKSGLADANRDGDITLNEWFDYAHNGVITKAGSKQTPMMWTYKRTGDISIAKSPSWIEPSYLLGYASFPRPVVEDIARLRRRMVASGLPPKITDHNLIIGSWNLNKFGQVYEGWDENPRTPKRNLRSLAYVAEIIKQFDVIALQEVAHDTTGLEKLLGSFLGPNWGRIVTDVVTDGQGNSERFAFVFDKRRVQPTRLVGEIGLPRARGDVFAELFTVTPYIAGFQVGEQGFALLTTHIKYGDVPEERLPELRALANYIAVDIRDLARTADPKETDLIVLGDFSIDQCGDNPLCQAFVSTGLIIPHQLLGLKTTYGTVPKHYDQIGWFMGELVWEISSAGVIDFAGALYPEFTLRQMAYRVSDHCPLWLELIIDRSEARMAQTLGVDPAMPNPLDVVPDIW